MDNSVLAHAQVMGVIPTNNVAEMATIVMALLVWQSMHLCIHMDLQFVMDLVHRGLLAMEQDSWLDMPYRNWAAPLSLAVLYKHLLYLLRRHNSCLKFSWVRGHLGDKMNKWANKLMKRGVEDPLQEINVSSPWTLRGWVDDTPVLHHQSLAHLTYCVVREMTPNPLFGPKWAGFCTEWTGWIVTHFGAELDITKHLPTLWGMNAPTGFKELLWKSALGSLPLGHC